MNFKEFLIESPLPRSKSKSISKKQAIELVRTRCKNAIKIEYPVIVRGMDVNDSNYLFTTPSLFERRSANTTNEYTLMIDNSPEWKNYPKRSESLICGTVANVGYAEGFGDIYIVLPIDNWPTKIGVCSKFDLWQSFKHFTGTKGLDNLNYQIRLAIGEAINDDDVPDYPTWEEFKELCKKTTKFLTTKNAVMSSAIKNTWKDVVNGKYTFEEQIRRYLDPKDNDIELLSYEQLAQITNGSEREVWLSNDSVLLRVGDSRNLEQVYTDFRNEVLRNEV